MSTDATRDAALRALLDAVADMCDLFERRLSPDGVMRQRMVDYRARLQKVTAELTPGLVR